MLAAAMLGATPLAVSCSSPDAEERADPPPPDPDPPLRERTAAGVRALIAAYDATAARHPGLAKELTPLRAEHAAHLAELRARPAASPTPPRVQPDPRRARTALIAAETEAARDRLRAVVAAASPDLARLLAAIGAAEAAHAALLRSGA